MIPLLTISEAKAVLGIVEANNSLKTLIGIANICAMTDSVKENFPYNDMYNVDGEAITAIEEIKNLKDDLSDEELDKVVFADKGYIFYQALPLYDYMHNNLVKEW